MKSIQQKKTIKRSRLKTRIRARLTAVNTIAKPQPRLSVFRSNLHIYAQVIDDTSAKTLASASDLKINNGTKAERAKMVGLEIAKQAKAVGISQVVFDRNGFKYTGRIKTVADAAREGGLVF
ncbi:50S ribosomal protein L18 [Candidatus Nomurabacteria bacterium RIFCSPHIGHO2_02_FULL_38_15]|uniref:Large ribosomal subunit protein uL18 n=1 Tax=Candidatus Nomurabacteria bacterium RIFCSPHIGHO2_02_FULL_38_15 TaxID=1801752 RepID=A0A1F6VQX3_9BACT|nr:MAG: 50S ribosomal protein L18 [Candidatus Nomurabacteria bacterium RIFCSPHIGHO2_02_FULL_38_15]